MLASFKDVIGRSQPGFVGLALLVYATSIPLVAWRWRVVLSAVTRRQPPLGPLILASLASSFVNNVTPSARLGGEACRVAALVSLRFATAIQATVAIAYERLSEMPALIGLALATLLVVGRIHVGAPSAVWTWLVAGGLALIGAVTVRAVAARAWRRLRDRRRGLESLTVAPSAIGMAALVSAAIWTLDVFRLRLIAAAFHAPIDLPQAATLAAITIVAGLIPTMGGLGVIEGGLVTGLIAMGVPPADAVAMTVVERAISYGLSTVVGFGALSTLGGRTLWNAVRVGTPAAEAATTTSYARGVPHL